MKVRNPVKFSDQRSDQLWFRFGPDVLGVNRNVAPQLEYVHYLEYVHPPQKSARMKLQRHVRGQNRGS